MPKVPADEPIVVEIDDDEDESLESYFEAQLAELDERLEQEKKKFNARISKIEKQVDNHEERIKALEEGVVLAKQPVEQQAQVQQQEPQGILDVTFGTIGNVLHSVVDTASYILEATVDIVTLGKAKRNHSQ
jgi:uncharacterized protein (UPF0335 family)